jgi:peptidoglycan endopeptidase LytF
MKPFIFLFICLFSLQVFSQENDNEFLAVNVDGKEAFMSTKTGVVIFREHAKTDASAFVTPENGDTYYVETTIHSVKKGETLSSIAKKHGLSIDKLKRDNKLKNSKLSIGQKIKINKNLSVKSLKPTMSSEKPRIVARLRPGQNPSELNMPPPDSVPSDVIKTPIKTKLKTEEEIVVEEATDRGTIEEKAIDKKVIETEVFGEEITTTIYTVKRGDTLYGIAKKHNMTIKELKTLNDLVLNNLAIGQKLKVK